MADQTTNSGTPPPAKPMNIITDLSQAPAWMREAYGRFRTPNYYAKTPDWQAAPGPAGNYRVGPEGFTASPEYFQNAEVQRVFRTRNADIYRLPPGQNQVEDIAISTPQMTFWQDPQRVARYRNFIRSQGPDYQPPEWMQPDQIEQAYQYLKFRNGDKPSNEWGTLPANDPGASWLAQMPTPPKEYQLPTDVVEPRAQQPPPPGDPFGDWSKLTPAEQFLLGTFLAPQPGTQGDPTWAKYTRAATQAALAIPGGAAVGGLVGSVVPGVGTAAGAFVGGTIAGVGTAYQTLTGQQVPILNDALQLFNLLPQGAERLIGLGKIAQDQGVQSVLNDLPSAWKAASLTYETQNTDLLNIYAGITNPIVAAFGGQQMQIANDGQVWQISRGIATPQALQGPRGVQAIEEARQRIAGGEDPLMVYADYQRRFGDTGTFNDFVQQTLIDPTLLLEHGTHRVLGEGAHLFGQERLAIALNEGAGNPLVAATPFGLKWLTKAITHGEEPAGIIKSLEKYRGWIQTDHFPAGTEPTRAADLSSFEKWAGGLDETGRIKELLPTEPKGGIPGMMQYVNSLTPASKVHALLSMFHNQINSLFSMADQDPETMVKMYRQAAGVDPVEAGSVGERLLNSPEVATITQALRDTLDGNWDQDLLLRYTSSSEKRGILQTAAQALNETTGQVLDEYRANPEALAERIKAAGVPVDAPTLKQAFDIFTGDDPAPWDPNQFQAQLTLTMSDKMDQALIKRYGIKPDPALLRASQALKGMQSLLLLGFNPAYFINNMTNNMMTRAVVGVFGYMTAGQIDSFLQRFGVTPDRLGEALGAAGMAETSNAALRKAMQAQDVIATTHRAVTAVNGKIGLFGKFSNWGEKIESKNATVIGMIQFLDKNWKVDKGLRRMRPEVEALLDKQAPGVKELIYRAAENGLNMKEINDALFGEAIQPEIAPIVDEAARQLFPSNPQAGAELLRKTGMEARMREALKHTTTPEQAAAVFDRAKQEVQAMVNQSHKAEIVHRAEDVQNRVLAEGHRAVLAEHNTLQERIARVAAQADGESWARTRDYVTQTYAGMLKALGHEGKNAELARIITRAMDDFRKFDKQRTKMLEQLRKASGTAARELKLQLDEQYREYNQRAQATAERLEVRMPAEPAAPPTDNAPQDVQPVAPPQPDPRTVELERLAQQYGLTDRAGRPVVRYLMNVVNKRRPAGEKFTEPSQVPLDVAEEALKDHQNLHQGEEALVPVPR